MSLTLATLGMPVLLWWAMNSWYQLMLLGMARGQYLNLSPRRTEQDWLVLWGLIQEVEVASMLTASQSPKEKSHRQHL